MKYWCFFEKEKGLKDGEFEQTARNRGNANANITFGMLGLSKVTFAFAFPGHGLFAHTRRQ